MVVSYYRNTGSKYRKCGSQNPDRWLKGSRNTHCQMGNYQVIIDFVQNFYDSVGYDEWKEKFRYEYKNNTAHLPCVYDYGRKGEVFCAYQILGINPFDLVVCLHQYKKNDRERKTLYRSEVIDVFEDVARLIEYSRAAEPPVRCGESHLSGLAEPPFI